MTTGVHVRRKAAMTLFALAAFLPASLQSKADTFPQNKPVTVIVGFPTGGATDIVARSLADALSKVWKQPVVVENRPGAATMIAAATVARAPADGHTLFFATSSIAVAKLTQLKPAADPIKDFVPIMVVASVPFMLVGSLTLPPTLKEVIALAKSKPDALNYASAGHGTSTHLVGELFRQETGVVLTHIPYKGAPAAMTAILTGDVQLFFDNPNSGLAQSKAGKVRAYAVTTPKRLELAPDVPTMTELGLPGATATSWGGLMAPAGTPKAVVDRIRDDVSEVLRGGVSAKIRGAGFEPAEIGPEGFERMLGEEITMWDRVLDAAGIKPE